NFHVQLDFDSARARLAVEAIQDDVANGHAATAKALRVSLYIALRVAVKLEDSDGLSRALQARAMQAVIVIGFGELIGDIGDLVAAVAHARAGTACPGTSGVCQVVIPRGDGWMIELVRVVESA